MPSPFYILTWSLVHALRTHSRYINCRYFDLVTCHVLIHSRFQLPKRELMALHWKVSWQSQIYKFAAILDLISSMERVMSTRTPFRLSRAKLDRADLLWNSHSMASKQYLELTRHL